MTREGSLQSPPMREISSCSASLSTASAATGRDAGPVVVPDHQAPHITRRAVDEADHPVVQQHVLVGLQRHPIGPHPADLADRAAAQPGPMGDTAALAGTGAGRAPDAVEDLAVVEDRVRLEPRRSSSARVS